MSLCYLIKLIEQCCFGSQISKSSSDIRNRNRLKLSRSHGLLPALPLSNIWTVIDRWIEHKFTTQNWTQVLLNIDVSHNLLINPYPPHVAERGLVKTPHPHKAVHVVYLQSLTGRVRSRTSLWQWFNTDVSNMGHNWINIDLFTCCKFSWTLIATLPSITAFPQVIFKTIAI